MKLKLKHLVEDQDRHGNVRLYVRVPGKPKVRIRVPIGSPEFWRLYREALEGTPPPASRAAPASLRWLCERYFASAEWKGLSSRTRQVRRAILERICMRDGDKPFARLEPRHIRARRDELADRPGAANNPARNVALIRTTGPGFHTWTLEEIAGFEARHPVGTRARLAMALLLYTGAGAPMSPPGPAASRAGTRTADRRRLAGDAMQLLSGGSARQLPSNKTVPPDSAVLSHRKPKL